MNNAGNTTNGYGFQAIPLLTGKGGITSWEAFDARTPPIAANGSGIATAYGMYLEPQKVTGVTTGYGVYQAGSSDTNYLAGNVGIGTARPNANLEVSGTAQFDGPVTYSGSQTVIGNVSTSGELISTVAPGPVPLQVASTTQVPNLNASLLGGQPASAFAPLAAANTFTGINKFSNYIAARGEGYYAGVEGVQYTASAIFQSEDIGGECAGVWGDTGLYIAYGVLGSADDGYGAIF